MQAEEPNLNFVLRINSHRIHLKFHSNFPIEISYICFIMHAAPLVQGPPHISLLQEYYRGYL